MRGFIKNIFLRPSCYQCYFKNENDENIALAKRVTDIFDGNIPLYFYYTDDKRYALQPRECFVEVNNTEIKELKRILGDENVVFVH